ncbi:MAG: IS30 family transposase [Akkermansia sp.]
MFLFVNAASTTTSTCIICPSIAARCRCKEGEDEDIFPPQIGWLAITCAEQALSGARTSFCLAVLITCDNGSAFLDYQSIEQSALNKGKRVKLYYAHPFSSFERGSNENANRLIRRKLPKKTSFETLTQQDVDCIAEWMNRYPLQMTRAEKLHCITLSA